MFPREKHPAAGLEVLKGRQNRPHWTRKNALWRCRILTSLSGVFFGGAVSAPKALQQKKVSRDGLPT
jgi:hypothetical protein